MHTHTHINTHTHRCIHTHQRMHTHTHTHTHVHTYMHTYKCTYMLPSTQSEHTYTHTHTNTDVFPSSLLICGVTSLTPLSRITMTTQGALSRSRSLSLSLALSRSLSLSLSSPGRHHHLSSSLAQRLILPSGAAGCCVLEASSGCQCFIKTLCSSSTFFS